MKTLTRTTCFLVAACLLAAGPAAAQEILTGKEDAEPSTAAADSVRAAPTDKVWRDVTVTTDDGWNLTDASVCWLSDGSRVRVTRPDGSWRDYLPWTVTAVHAADGRDLTAEIAGARPGGSAPNPADAPRAYGEIGTEPRVYTGLGGQHLQGTPFVVAGTVGGGYGAFTGDWFTGFQNALSLQATVRIGTGPRNWVTLSYRRQGGGNRTFTGYDIDYNPVSVDVDLRVDEYMVMFGALTKPRGVTRNVPYVEFGLAMMNHVAKTEAADLGAISYSETKLGLVLQLGGLIALGESAVVDVGLNIAHKPGIFSDEESGGTIFGLHAGIGLIKW